jgi:hypothetical protein
MVFSQVSLPEVARISKRTVFGSLAVGLLGLVLCVVLRATLVGLGLCVGIALGITNFRMVQRSVARAGRRHGPRRRPLAMNTVSRLAVITGAALGLLFVSFDLGFGLLAGLAAFQFLLVFGVLRSLLKGVGLKGVGLKGVGLREPDGSLLGGVPSLLGGVLDEAPGPGAQDRSDDRWEDR